MTGYTVEEFVNLPPYFQAAFDESKSPYTFDGFRRENRRYVPYRNSLLTDDRRQIALHLELSQATAQPDGTRVVVWDGARQSVALDHLLHQVLNQALDAAATLPAREVVEQDKASTPHLWQDGT